MAGLELTRRNLNVRLSIAGSGVLDEKLKKIFDKNRVFDCVTFFGKLPRDVLLSKYQKSDLFVFPSLHDSSGNVVVEALANSLPVISLDLGGPKYYVDNTCGAVISTKDKNYDQVVIDMADKISELVVDKDKLYNLSMGALARAKKLTWENQVNRVYDYLESVL